MNPLLIERCRELPPGTKPLSASDAAALLTHLDGWTIRDGRELVREFRFDDYYQTIAFVNGTAVVSHRENHHPDLEVGYNRCVVRYSTHSVGGLSRNDFICATKIDALQRL
jgi:4a-hydroxytetrahydrobiopterin dehydratase